jgi:hypothetical protein
MDGEVALAIGPLALMALPALVSAIGGVVKGIAGHRSDRTQQQYNKKKLAELLQLQEKDELGLTAAEKQLEHTRVYAPAAAASAAAAKRAETLSAAGQRTSGADLAQLQLQQAQQNAQAQQQAAQLVNAADLAKEGQQRGEIEARLGEKSRMAQRDVDLFAKPIIDAAATATAFGVDSRAPPAVAGAPAAPSAFDTLQKSQGVPTYGPAGAVPFTDEEIAKLKALLGGA